MVQNISQLRTYIRTGPWKDNVRGAFVAFAVMHETAQHRRRPKPDDFKRPFPSVSALAESALERFETAAIHIDTIRIHCLNPSVINELSEVHRKAPVSTSVAIGLEREDRKITPVIINSQVAIVQTGSGFRIDPYNPHFDFHELFKSIMPQSYL